MKQTKTQFTKLVIAIGVGGLLAGVMYAQLDIPTNITNAIQTIKEIRVTDNGNNAGHTLIRLNGSGAGATLTISGTTIVGDPGTNQVDGARSSVLGGEKNKILGTDSNSSSIVGGKNNTLSNASLSTIAGGDHNTISGDDSSIGGGQWNIITGAYSTIPGGQSNQINGKNSFAAGTNARALANGTFVWSDSYKFWSTGTFDGTTPNTFLIRAQNGVGINTNSPTATLDVNGNLVVRNIPLTSDDTNALMVQSNGSVSKRGLNAVAFNGESDPRVTTLINGLTTNYATKWNGSKLVNSSIFDNGNVGIGINNPLAKLHVVGGSIFQGTTLFQGTKYHTWMLDGSDENIYLRAGLDNGHVVLADQGNQKVGIGGADPLYKLNVNGSTNIKGNTNLIGNVIISGSSVVIRELPMTSDDTNALMVQGNGSISKRGLNAVAFNGESDPKTTTLINGLTTNYATKWNGSKLVNSSIFDNGNVGIGTTDLINKFNVEDSDHDWASSMVNTQDNNGVKVDIAGSQGDGIGIQTSNDNSDRYAIAVASTRNGHSSDAFFVTNDNAVGIRTRNPSAVLDVLGDIKTSILGVCQESNDANGSCINLQWETKIPGETFNSLGVVGNIHAFGNVKAAGNVVAGGSATIAGNVNANGGYFKDKLEVTNIGYQSIPFTINSRPVISLIDGGNGDQATLMLNGYVTWPGGNWTWTKSYKKTMLFGDLQMVGGSVYSDAFYYNSDRRLKKDIVNITGALDKINQLNGYTFTWRSNDKKDVGVIAQEVETVFPALVHTDDKGIKSVEYANLVAPIIEAIKELTHQVDSLFTKYFDQQQQITALEKRVEKLEAAK